MGKKLKKKIIIPLTIVLFTAVVSLFLGVKDNKIAEKHFKSIDGTGAKPEAPITTYAIFFILINLPGFIVIGLFGGQLDSFFSYIILPILISSTLYYLVFYYFGVLVTKLTSKEGKTKNKKTIRKK